MQTRKSDVDADTNASGTHTKKQYASNPSIGGHNVCVCVLGGLPSLSTTFQSYFDGVW